MGSIPTLSANSRLLILSVVTAALGLLELSPPSTVIAQTREPEKFDVVSVKENRSGGQPFIRPEPSGLTVVNKTALELIMYEFNVLKRDVVGELPDWAKTTTFDVIAKTPNAPLTSSRLRAMTRALLEDRFGLEATFEQVEGPVFALVMEPGGLRPPDRRGGLGIRISESTCAVDPPLTVPPRVPNFNANCGVTAIIDAGAVSGLFGSRVTMQQLAKRLSMIGGFDRPVLDRTGLTGEFDFVVMTRADMVAPTSQARFLIAMREQLGLTLRPEQGSFEVLRVRRIEQPSPN